MMQWLCVYTQQAHKKQNKKYNDGLLTVSGNTVVLKDDASQATVFSQPLPKDFDVNLSDGDEITDFKADHNILIVVGEPVGDGHTNAPQQQQPQQLPPRVNPMSRPVVRHNTFTTARTANTAAATLPQQQQPAGPVQQQPRRGSGGFQPPMLTAVTHQQQPQPQQPRFMPPPQQPQLQPINAPPQTTKATAAFQAPRQERSADEIMNLLGLGGNNPPPQLPQAAAQPPPPSSLQQQQKFPPPPQRQQQPHTFNNNGAPTGYGPPQQQQQPRQSSSNTGYNNQAPPPIRNEQQQQYTAPPQQKPPPPMHQQQQQQQQRWNNQNNTSRFAPPSVAAPPTAAMLPPPSRPQFVPPTAPNNGANPTYNNHRNDGNQYKQQPQQQQPMPRLPTNPTATTAANAAYRNSNNTTNTASAWQSTTNNNTASNNRYGNSNTNNTSTNSNLSTAIDLRLPTPEEASRPRRTIPIPDTFSTAMEYSSVWSKALVEEVNLRNTEVAQKFHGALGRLGLAKGASVSGERLEPQLRQGGVSYYGSCELFMWRNQTKKIKEYFKPGKNKRKRGDDNDDDAADDEPSEPTKAFNYYLILKTNKAKFDQFRKNDLWFISNNPMLQSGYAPGQVGDRNRTPWVVAVKSLWHGPNKDGKFEIELLSAVPFNMGKTQPVYAVKGADVSMELSLLDVVKVEMLAKVPLLPYILGRSSSGGGFGGGGGLSRPPLAQLSTAVTGATAMKTNNKDSNIPQQQQDGGDGKKDEYAAQAATAVDEDAEETITRFKLNEEQSGVVHAVARWSAGHHNIKNNNNTNAAAAGGGGSNAPLALPVSLIHGPFGSGKSTLLVALLHYILKKRKYIGSGLAGCRVLVAAHTNVAVDRVLEGLLESGSTDFLRLGSLRRITSQQLYPHSLHCSESNSSAAGELKEMLKTATNVIERNALQSELTAAEQGAERHRKRLLKTVPVVGVTCCSSSLPVLDGQTFDIVILDECSQIIEPLSLAPIIRSNCRFLIAAGDPLQLPPVISSPTYLSTNNNNKKSIGMIRPLFSRLATVLSTPPHFLRRQYRCHPDISAISNACFYNGHLIDGCAAADRQSLLPGLANVAVLDVRGQEQPVGRSLCNRQEGTAISGLVRQLLTLGMKPSQIGVICLYRAQVQLVEQMLTSVVAQASSLAAAGAAASALREKNTSGNAHLKKQLVDEASEEWKDDTQQEDDEEEENQLVAAAKGDDADSPPAQKEEEEEEEGPPRVERLSVATCDAFQGAERDIIILSTSTTNPGAFAADGCRINVALTRAKRNLVLVGHGAALQRGGGEALGRLLVMAKERGSYFEGGLPSLA